MSPGKTKVALFFFQVVIHPREKKNEYPSTQSKQWFSSALCKGSVNISVNAFQSTADTVKVLQLQEALSAFGFGKWSLDVAIVSPIPIFHNWMIRITVILRSQIFR